jgi:hypothetical protein
VRAWRRGDHGEWSVDLSLVVHTAPSTSEHVIRVADGARHTGHCQCIYSSYYTGPQTSRLRRISPIVSAVLTSGSGPQAALGFPLEMPLAPDVAHNAKSDQGISQSQSRGASRAFLSRFSLSHSVTPRPKMSPSAGPGIEDFMSHDNESTAVLVETRIIGDFDLPSIPGIMVSIAAVLESVCNLVWSFLLKPGCARIAVGTLSEARVYRSNVSL